jgi:hypothetical protein
VTVTQPANYVAATIAELTEALPGCEPDLIRLYALLALTSGKQRGLYTWPRWPTPAPWHPSTRR